MSSKVNRWFGESVRGSLHRRSATLALALGLALAAHSACAQHKLSSLDPETISLVEAFSGHIAVLPPTGGENLETTPIGRSLTAAGLQPHLVWLTAAQWADTNFASALRFPLALYLNHEVYVQTAQREGDCDRALRHYLAGGGTLLVLPNGPFPFHYNQNFKPVNFAPSLGLGIGASGFEQPPTGRQLSFRVNTNQTLFQFPEPVFPFPPPHEADQRWRGIADLKAAGARYTPLISLFDNRGQPFADGAALVVHDQGPLAGGRLLYVWFSLLADESRRLSVLRDSIRLALQQRPPPPARLACRRTLRPPQIDGKIDETIWRLANATSSFKLAGSPPRPAPRSTTTRARWDSQNLYLAFHCQNAVAANAPIQVSDSVQVVFPTKSETKDLQVLTLSRKNELGIVSQPPNPAVSNLLRGVRSATLEQPDSWSAELAIPWALLAAASPPLLDTEVALQFARSNPKPAAAANELSAWSACQSLDQTERFGRLALAADPWSDDFEARKEAADGSTNWRITGGTWRIDGGTLLGGNCVADAFESKGITRGDHSWRDYAVSVRFKIESRGTDWRDGPWFGLRCRPDGDGYHLMFTALDCQLHKVIYGVTSSDANPLARAPWKPDQEWHALRIEARANHLKVEIDGKTLLEVRDDAHLHLPSLRSGGIVLSARKASASQGQTLVRFDDLETIPLLK